mgnify:CR=1 FL=1
MKKAILTTKVGMTQIFNEDGVLTPVTVLQAGPCVVTQVKTEENDGYSAVQVGFVDKKEKGINKPQKGHFDKAGVAPKRFVREFRFENAEEYTVGQEIKADIFAAGDKIDATATSKGKGYAGGIKRHGLNQVHLPMVLNIIVMQVLMVWLLILAKYQRKENARTNGSRKSYYSES